MNEQLQISTRELQVSPAFQKIRFSLVAVVIILSCGSGWLSLSIPKFQEIYSDFGTPLPFITSYVVNTQYGFVLVSFLALTIVIATLFFRSSASLLCILSALVIMIIAQFIILIAALYIPIFTLSGGITGSPASQKAER